MQPIFVEAVHRIPRGSPSGLGSFALGDYNPDAPIDYGSSGINLNDKYNVGGSQDVTRGQNAAANLGVDNGFYSSAQGNPIDSGAYSAPSSYGNSFNFDPTWGGQLQNGGTSAAYGQQAASGSGVADFFNSFFSALTGPKTVARPVTQLQTQPKKSALPLVLGGVALAGVVGAVVLFSSGSK